MPYISKEQVKEKRAQLKKALPQYKLSITTENYSGIKVAIMSGPTDFGTGYKQLNQFRDYRRGEWNRETGSYEPNLPVAEVMEVIMPILNEGKGPGYEDGDYGNIPDYYTWVQIGKWDRDYVCTAKVPA